MIGSMNLCLADLAVVEEVSRREKASDCLYPAGNAIDWIFGIWVALISRSSQASAINDRPPTLP